MYPRVKMINKQEHDNGTDNTKLALREGNQIYFPPSVSKSCTAETNYVSMLGIPLIPVCKGKSRQVEEKKSNVRVSSPILRPRAVLSSPDNDELIGKQNKTISKATTASSQNKVATPSDMIIRRPRDNHEKGVVKQTTVQLQITNEKSVGKETRPPRIIN